MVRRAGIHRIAAVVARRTNTDTASSAATAELAQLELFAVEGTNLVRDAATTDRVHAGSPEATHDAAAAVALRDEVAAETTHGPPRADSPVIAVAACPSCTWWVTRSATRCDCCGVALVDGQLAPQGELAFAGPAKHDLRREPSPRGAAS